MKFTVKKTDSELTYASAEELRGAYARGKFSPDDPVLVEGAAGTQPAKALSELASLRKSYLVRSKDGELTYGSMEEVKTAYVLGLIEPEDEVLEAGASKWRKANTIQLLVTARRVSTDRTQSNKQRAWTFGALVLAIFTFYCLIKGYYMVGGVLGFAVAGLLTQVTVLAARRR